MKGITTIAALPGSGAGSMSSLPAEVGKWAGGGTGYPRPPQHGVCGALPELLPADPSVGDECGEDFCEPMNFGGFPEGGYVGSLEDAPWLASDYSPVCRPTMSERAPALLEGLKRPADLLDMSGGGQ